MATGARYAAMAGIFQMPKLRVECWDTLAPRPQIVARNIEEGLVLFGLVNCPVLERKIPYQVVDTVTGESITAIIDRMQRLYVATHRNRAL